MLDPEYIEQVQHEMREFWSNVQQQGYHAACNGGSRDDNPYGSSKPGNNYWIYGFMLGHAAKRKEDHDARR